MRPRDLMVPSQSSNRVDKLPHNDTMKIRDSFIHVTMTMDVPGAGAISMLAKMKSIATIAGPGCGASGIRVPVTKPRHHDPNKT